MLYVTELIRCLVLIFLTKNVCSSFFVGKQYGNDNYICVTNSTFGLSSIRNDVAGRLNYVSTYVPLGEYNLFDCKIDEGFRTREYFIKTPWDLKSSITSKINNLILDERWEDFDVIKTDFVDKYKGTLKFENALDITTSDFVLPLSIRTDREAHIFLCDGKKVAESNCYWFMLQAFSGKGSAIRKCSANSIPNISRAYPTDPCKTPVQNISHPAFPTYLSRSKWSHFILSKEKNVLTFSVLANYEMKKILEYQDPKEVFEVRYVIVYSKMVNALWKFHNAMFLYTEQESNEVQIGPNITPHGKTICVSMYIFMCPSCQLKLSLATQRSILKEQIFVPELSSWHKIKFVIDEVDYQEPVHLLVSTIGSFEDKFWAIDNIRLCQEKEVRMITLTENLPCQLMNNDQDIIFLKTTTQDNVALSNCPEDTIGDFCMKCSWIFENCEKITLCDKNSCYCSAGYSGQDCHSS